MKIFLTLIAVACLPGLAFGTPVRRAKHVLPDDFAISEEARNATLAHIAQLAKDSEEKAERATARADAMQAIVTEQNKTIGTQAGDLTKAKTATSRIRTVSVDLISQIGALNEELSAEKWGRFKDKLLGWPITLGFGVLLGIAITLFSRVGAKVAALTGRVVVKATTGI